ncbi:hypothetical protein KIW84_021878 [Lathyrus oleraceus]|uniref:Uncharacterized protein n=1 Tax=Pisum sativum TaxID=3888 RepID=A0A9D4YBR9_PEA|nr:hypothetical protein KIW84_021878 [Pisum sativum]
MELGGGSFGADERPSGFLYSESFKLISRVSMPGFPSVFLSPSSVLFVTEAWLFIMLLLRRNCSPSEQASLGHFLDWATRELGLCSFKVSALQNKLECFEERLARLMGKFWGMTTRSMPCVQYRHKGKRITMTTNTSNNILRSILDKEKLYGTNFLDWHRNLRIVLKHDKKLYVLETPVPQEEPPSSALKAERDAYKKHVDDANETACLMLATMN